MDRRKFLQLSGAALSTLAAKGIAGSGGHTESCKEFVGVLTDISRCIGCRSCEVACAKAHDLPVPDINNDKAFEKERQPSEKQYTVVNRYKADDKDVYVKKQCMHCWQPACSSACLTNAMEKTKDGPVVWIADKCMGCRFCMVSCPFSIPKAEYNEWNLKIQKCDMCIDRLGKGELPACVAACPTDALTFGMKRDLMEAARMKIYNFPKKYVHQIYGEHVVGGTGWLYLSEVPFEKLGFRQDLGNTPYPEFTKHFLYGVPIMEFGAPALLLGLHFLTERKNENND